MILLILIRIYDLTEFTKQAIEVSQTVAKDYRGNCLNGIAYYPKNETFWITGKFWPYFWEVKFE